MSKDKPPFSLDLPFVQVPHAVISDAAQRLSPEAFRTFVLLLLRHYHDQATSFNVLSEGGLGQVAMGNESIVDEINRTDLPFKISIYYELQTK